MDMHETDPAPDRASGVDLDDFEAESFGQRLRAFARGVRLAKDRPGPARGLDGSADPAA